jgi:hypothetical protein
MAKSPEKAVDSRASSRSRQGSGRVESAQESNAGNPRPLAKSTDPAYMKFTTYIRKSTHLGVKTRLVSKEKELSDLVEELLSNWLKENDSFST